MRNMLPTLLLLCAAAQACSEGQKTGACGESFCLPAGAQLLSKETPVEDFNLYRVEAEGKRFLIYEGNHPKRAEGSIVIPIKKDWPNFLEVSGPCTGPGDCAVKTFAAELVPR
jgi:hypothetical protein